MGNHKSSKSYWKAPGVGDYDVKHFTIEHDLENMNQNQNQSTNPLLSTRPKSLIPFNSRTDRFENPHKDENDQYWGPGYYEHEIVPPVLKSNKVKAAKVKPSEDKHFLSRTDRFGKDTKPVPGPGEYTTKSAWFKKSYNMIFAE